MDGLRTYCLARAQAGDDTLGLDIAWHCMRCGRKEEATWHLLSGARGSIRRGAVHEAERKLRSGLYAFVGPDLKEARFLLTDLLQQQGRWADSLGLLASFENDRQSVDGRCLEGRALVRQRKITDDEAATLADSLREYLADQRLPARTRIRALECAGELVVRDGGQGIALHFMAAMAGAIRIGWSVDDLVDWELNALHIEHHSHTTLAESEGTLDQLLALAERVNARTTVNARSGLLLSGIALCHRRAGRYLEAISQYEEVFLCFEDSAGLTVWRMPTHISQRASWKSANSVRVDSTDKQRSSLHNVSTIPSS